MDSELLESVLKKGAATWNKWRSQDPTLQVDLSGAMLRGINLNNMDLFLANLSQADLRRAYMLQANLRGASLVEADMRNTFLIQSDLRGADLTGANFQEANLSGADLRNANLTRTDLRWANLGGADLQAALLLETQLMMADLSGADLTGVCIQGWAINVGTRFNELKCDYVFLNYHPEQQRKFNRFPQNERQILSVGEFAQLFQLNLTTIELSFPDDLNWAAFLKAYSQVKSDYNQEPITIRALEMNLKGDLVIKLDIPVTINRLKVDLALKEYYGRYQQDLEARYQQDLHLSPSQIQEYQKRYRTLTSIIQHLANEYNLGLTTHPTQPPIQPPEDPDDMFWTMS